MHQHSLDDFLCQVACLLQEARSARKFLPSFPGLLKKQFPAARCVFYYKEAEGNAFRAYGEENAGAKVGLPLVREEANLIESFTGRAEAMRANNQTQMYFDLFDHDCEGLISRMGINLIAPLRVRAYYRGLLLARTEPGDERTIQAIIKAAQTAAAMFIPIIEAERMEFENDKNYYRLFKFDRLVLLGQMAASLAHELRTPLTTVLFEIAAIKSHLGTDAEVAGAYEKVNREIGRASQMVESLLVFSKFKNLNMSSLRLREFIETTLREIPARKIPAQVKVQVLADEEIEVTSDGDRLKQVFINVLFNALEALAGQLAGTIDIRLYSEYHDLPRNARHIIAVCDTGPGIPDAIKDRVLEPFFTTKKEGTGLGLYISYSIMKTLKGDLEIHSNKQGTRVNLVLPAR